ncbi:AbrB/MazE/SpoVT family DNA-binding domain-containing protein [Streptoalloteichus hindustanus]|uniref:Looped-hinge helix DNA binding domain-containing protein, AbrB family n=1 Tax=Streptoalloteichus hindustanus TaxID=2017 RepID=A0A1M5M7N7_STRHI|nr:AbrB/MazE/SpoVT family DNA-binding domain-containing protein [Streptoalloteichus hindustanus]SHG73255.1 hypothetical protein SAMN05444320_11320 [Streptoalloteichus hindustanus]
MTNALPLPAVPALRATATVYGLAAVDTRGRVADQITVRALGWAPGTRLNLHEAQGLLVIQPDPEGVSIVGGQGYLRLPAPVRHWFGLVPGDRVLLVADPARGRLVVHPPSSLDALISECHTRLLGGEPA